MSYITNVPAASDKLSVSQGQLQGNTNQLNTTFLVNHYALTDGTSNNGKHSVIQTPAQASDTTTNADEPAIYAKSVFSTAPYVLQFTKLGPHVPPNSGDNSLTPLSTLQVSGALTSGAPGNSVTLINMAGAGAGSMIRVAVSVVVGTTPHFNEIICYFDGTNFVTQSNPAPTNAILPVIIANVSEVERITLNRSASNIVLTSAGLNVNYKATISFISIL